VDISTEMVKELRERTGAGILDSKTALQATQGDMKRAIDLLRERGLARAAKKAGREAKEGLIEAYTSPDARTGVLVEVNCETDFVARTPEFKTLAREVALTGVTANTVCPGPTDTPALRSFASNAGQDAEKVISGMTRAVPMRRLALPADVAAAVAFFASDATAYITGQTLCVDGGMAMHI